MSTFAMLLVLFFRQFSNVVLQTRFHLIQRRAVLQRVFLVLRIVLDRNRTQLLSQGDSQLFHLGRNVGTVLLVPRILAPDERVQLLGQFALQRLTKADTPLVRVLVFLLVVLVQTEHVVFHPGLHTILGAEQRVVLLLELGILVALHSHHLHGELRAQSLQILREDGPGLPVPRLIFVHTSLQLCPKLLFQELQRVRPGGMVLAVLCVLVLRNLTERLCRLAVQFFDRAVQPGNTVPVFLDNITSNASAFLLQLDVKAVFRRLQKF
mmetsp:Transcript_48822/g.129398  ORF Transcript_48822/g.129398 Transcript_48822/m.129398 type:complete len:266 (+) Transcript_48822:1705-2502(+)